MKSNRNRHSSGIHSKQKPVQLDRVTFVNICDEVINEVKKEITAGNQFSGYKKYRRNNKENYVANFRDEVDQLEIDHGFSLTNTYNAIQYAHLVRCREFALYTCYKIKKKLEELNANALIIKESSTSFDHGFLTIQIQLKDEKIPSEWEIDAWDPRIIDKTIDPNGDRKNKEVLHYGSDPNSGVFFYTKDNDENQIPVHALRKRFVQRDFHPAEEGDPSDGSLTPDNKILTKHKKIYKDYPLEDAYKNKKLPKNGYLTMYQKASKWQKEEKEEKEPRKKPKR